MKYNVITNSYNQNQNVPLDGNCNGWTAINIGTTIVTVNGIPLHPGTPGTNNGESFTIGGNAGEIFTGRISLTFATGTGQVLIIQKFYFNECGAR
jgi:hypothetical protein